MVLSKHSNMHEGLGQVVQRRPLELPIDDAFVEAGAFPQVPLDQVEYDLRAREVAALRQWVAAPAAALRRDQSPILTPEYMARIIPK